MAQLHLLTVTLSEPDGLDISDAELEVPGGPGAGLQVVAWQLELPVGVTGKFLPKGAFAWVNSPKWGVFSAPRRSDDGLSLIMSDDNRLGSDGRWTYVLHVGVPDEKGRIYSTTYTDIENKTTRNPVIINR